MANLWTGEFWKAAAERAAKTFAQVLALMLVGGMAQSGGFDVLHADWITALSYAAGGALLSLATSVASDAATGNGPSLTDAEVYPGRHRPQD